MARQTFLFLSLGLSVALSSCGPEPGPPQSQPADPQTDGADGQDGGDATDGTAAGTPFDDVPLTDTIALDGLSCDVHVVRTEMDVPHLYAHDRADLARVHGYLAARDRFFSIDLARRLGQGRVSEILGADALDVDIESRSIAMTFVAEQLLTTLTDDHVAWFTAYAEGINAYIDAVKAGNEPVPSELALAGPLLGAEDPSDLMAPFTLADMAGFMAVLVYELGYETGDIGRARNAARIPTFEGETLGELRGAGVWDDIYNHIVPLHAVASTDGWGRNGAVPAGSADAARRRPRINAPIDLLDRLDDRMERLQQRLGRDHEVGWGSNAWAVAGSATPDGQALLAGDGHLPLSVPSLFWQVGLDTSVLGDGDTHQVGLTFPGMPFLAVGTNGDVAWSQTQLSGDITDWYTEEIQVGATGLPEKALFQGEFLDLQVTSESIDIAEVPILGSEGGTFTFDRFTTADGRWIADIEGLEVDPDTIPDLSAVVWMGGDAILPGDTNGDGKITAISFDYAALDAANILLALDGFGHAETVEDVRQATRHLVAYSQNIVAADAAGSVLYTGYQAVPCRAYLPREDGWWVEGADPNLLLDGTTYGGFTIPLDADLRVDESFADDPYRCVVPFEEYPHAVDPDAGFVQSANNDPAGITFDNDLLNEPWYIGGPWTAGFRGHSIESLLEQSIEEGWADADGMALIQADHHSSLGALFVPDFIAAIQRARTASEGETVEPGSAQARLAALYAGDAARLDAVETRLQTWLDGGLDTPSGVETFYHTPREGEVEDAVATMIFNAWLPRVIQTAFDDEGFPDVWEPNGSTGRIRALRLFLAGRGVDNPLGLSSWNPATGESAFWDIRSTEPIETSEEVLIASLIDALDFLSGEGEGDAGGFGTDDMGQWVWGLRHQVRFDSLLGDFLPSDGAYSFLAEQFSITTDTLPLADDLESGDPRRALDHFPRPADNFAVDAGNPGLSGTRFTHGSGPVFRMVISLGPAGVSGWNILPGGQSALTDSEHFADQARLWLANEALPVRFSLEDVLEGATGRERFTGAGACD